MTSVRRVLLLLGVAVLAAATTACGTQGDSPVAPWEVGSDIGR